MKLTMLAKDTTSNEEKCPCVYLAESGEFVVQGGAVDTDTHNELVNLLPGETAVRISPEVVFEAARRYNDQRTR